MVDASGRSGDVENAASHGATADSLAPLRSPLSSNAMCLRATAGRHAGLSLKRIRCCVVLALASLAFPSTGAGQTYRLMHSFDGDGGTSHCTLLQTSDGKLYGTTEWGGASGQGSVFVLVPNGPGAFTFATLHSFIGGDGANPRAGVTQGPDGYFYGTTENGGATSGGTIFRIDQQGNLVTLYSFPYLAAPRTRLVLATDGNLYGATSTGIIFRMTPSGIYTLLYSFNGGVESSLIQGRDGNLYGTSGGGVNGLGTVFRMDLVGGVTILHNFIEAEGFQATGTLVQATDGDFYGTAEVGGSGRWGTAFRMDMSGTLTVLHSFSQADGQNPSGLVQAADGNFYGTTWGGGANGWGTVFRLSPTGVFSVVHNFTGANGVGQKGALIQGAGGSFYGTTSQSGRNNVGTVFKLDGSGNVTTLRDFGLPEGATPRSTLLRASDGNIYGTASEGGAFGSGTVFRIDSGGALTILYSFSGYLVLGPDGAYPQAGLIQATDGYLYGTTSGGGAFGNGTVYRVSLTGELTVIHSFTTREGSAPLAALVQATDGNFYGTTSRGGSNGYGTLFRMDSSGGLTVLHIFLGRDGAEAHSSLIQATDGNFYGTASVGGANGYGTVFRMDSLGNVSVLHAFSGADDGSIPHAGLIQASDGKLYGTTTGGSYQGTIFRVDLSGNLATLHAFNLSDGANPEAGLIEAYDGAFYGTTPTGGSGGEGTVFRMDSSGNVTVLYAFGVHAEFTSDGQMPVGGLLEISPGVFYGTASAAAAGRVGAVFSLSLEPPPTAAGLVLDAPANATSGTPFTVTVRAIDAMGRTAEGYRGSITISVADPLAVLPFRYTFTAVDAGAHTFVNGFILFAAGIQSLNANDSTLSLGATGKVAVSMAQWIITIAKYGPGGGRVTSTPAGIDCGPTCSGTFPDSTVVAMKVGTEPGFVFGGWGGNPDCADSTVKADSNKICIAKFNLTPLQPARPQRPPVRRLNPRGIAPPSR